MYPAIVIEIKRVDMNKPVNILNKNIESISLFDMKGLGMVLPPDPSPYCCYTRLRGNKLFELNWIEPMGSASDK